MSRALLGLGANLGDRQDTLTRAVEALAALPRTRVARVSSLYETAPVGYTDQPDFLNMVRSWIPPCRRMLCWEAVWESRRHWDAAAPSPTRLA